ncbi:MAG: hypothetical protein EON93_07800 [Burkholderiales bacterium]|nr:MAG: hypothetical protein EON93_07800 [Burkholderiales bacterium]
MFLLALTYACDVSDESLGLANALHFNQALGRGAERGGDGAEPCDQILGDGLGIDTRDEDAEQEFKQLVVAQG